MYNKVRDKLGDYHKLLEQTTKRRLTTTFGVNTM